MHNKLLLSVLLLSILILSSCDKDKRYVKKITNQRISIDNNLPVDKELNTLIAPYKNAINDEMEKTLCYSPQSMFKNDTPYNTAIGNMMADAVFERITPLFKQRHNINIDGVLLNHGGIRAGINKGIVTTKTAYDIMPFENMVVVAKLKGTQAKKIFDYLSKSKRAHPISNMSLQVGPNWKIKSLSLNNKKIVDDQYYFIATSDYLVKGGSNMNFFKKADTIYQSDYKLRNLLLDYFKSKDTLLNKADNRIQMLK